MVFIFLHKPRCCTHIGSGLHVSYMGCKETSYMVFMEMIGLEKKELAICGGKVLILIHMENT